jgi:hypothetical protein
MTAGGIFPDVAGRRAMSLFGTFPPLQRNDDLALSIQCGGCQQVDRIVNFSRPAAEHQARQVAWDTSQRDVAVIS